MEPAMFDELVQRVGPRIEKQDTNMRKALPIDRLEAGYHSEAFHFDSPLNDTRM